MAIRHFLTVCSRSRSVASNKTEQGTLSVKRIFLGFITAVFALGTVAAFAQAQRSKLPRVATGTQAILNAGDPLLSGAGQIEKIIAFANARRLPTLFESRVFVDAGGLMSSGPDFSALHRHAADYVDKILKGAKPGDLPIEQPTKFELIINMKTVKALGFTIPQSLLVQADEVDPVMVRS
jgi:ABC-type uncharacterized transport system substrate-binding protein